jgi:glycosyltransferase involved in cell wall biosynthesis
MIKNKRIIIAYACENSGSEPGVGYYWTKALSDIYIDDDIVVITRKNNNISRLESKANINKIGLDLNQPFLKIKKILGIKIYYFIWTFLVFFHLLFNYKTYKGSKVHHLTFTPIYVPPIYFMLPFDFIWGPIGGGESYPLSYLKNMKIFDQFKEVFRFFLKYSIYINPLFYIACSRSSKIICSTYDTAKIIPKLFKIKVEVELMVFDKDKEEENIVIKKDVILANRLISWKMTHLFVEAFYEYNQLHKTDFRLIIIGNGSYYNDIKKYINNDDIVHIERFDQRSDMLDLLKHSSLFISMSLRDSGAASLLEAISYGTPFLVTNTGAHKVFLEKDIGYSFTVESFSKDKNKIIDMLKKILDTRELDKERLKIKSVYSSYFCENKKNERIKKLLE